MSTKNRFVKYRVELFLAFNPAAKEKLEAAFHKYADCHIVRDVTNSTLQRH